MQNTIQTGRLILREWRDEDLIPFAALNSDPRVMKHFMQTLDSEQSDRLARRIRSEFDKNGYGLWAVEIKGGAPFAGFIGLASPTFQARFTPCVEIGWRLAFEHQGYGYATEGAGAVLDFAFQQINLNEVVSFTSVENLPSIHVMEKIGMKRDPENFLHPAIPDGHPLQLHVLYRKTSP